MTERKNTADMSKAWPTLWASESMACVPGVGMGWERVGDVAGPESNGVQVSWKDFELHEILEDFKVRESCDWDGQGAWGWRWEEDS